MQEQELKEALQHCEEAEHYGQSPVHVSANGAEIVVISDLHLAAGKMTDGRFSGTENFFGDSSLHRFIHTILARLDRKQAILIINGDVVDFLRITEYPQREEEFQDWHGLLQELGITKSLDHLRHCISKKEIKFGMKTHSYKSVWKLARCVHGHPRFFQALTEWLEQGHQIIISKGNHDLEWYWREVRNCLRLVLAKDLCRMLQGKDPRLSLKDVLVQHISKNLLFVDDAMVIDGTFYIEHGHRYDKYTNVVGKPLLNDHELNIPFGSFLNRYLLNQIELDYPYVDNVRPTTNILPLLIRQRFFTAMKLLFWYAPFMLRMIPKRYFHYMFGRLAAIVAAVGVPVGLGLLYLFVSMPKLEGQLQSLLAMNWLRSGVVTSFAAMVAAYLLSRIVAYFQLSEPSSLAVPAMKIFEGHPEYKLSTMGHTHNPDQRVKDGRWFYNTGTWIPIVELDTAQIRGDKTYTFLHFRRDQAGELLPTMVERWDDEAERAEALVIVSED